MEVNLLAKQKEGVYKNIIKYAKEEFLEYGYLDASLRRIAALAHTTTGSIYSRFKDKQGLYEAIVGDTYNDIMHIYKKAQNDFTELDPKTQTESVGEYSGDAMVDMLKYCFEHIDTAKLLLTGSQGTKYEGMIDEMVEEEIKSTHDYQYILQTQGIQSPHIDPHLEHMIITGMFNTFFELIIHETPYEEALLYLKDMRAFYTAGWKKILGQ